MPPLTKASRLSTKAIWVRPAGVSPPADHGHQPLDGLDAPAADREGHEHGEAADHGRQHGRDHADGQGQQERDDAPVGRRQIVQERRPSKLC